MASDFDWTADAVTCLRAFWQDGHSTAEIGRRMGTSKNAVVGKAHRLDLPPRPSPIRAKGTGSTPRPPTPAQTRSPGQPPPPYPVADSSPPGHPPRPLAVPQVPPTRADLPPPPLALAKPERPAPTPPAVLLAHRPSQRNRVAICAGRPGFRFCDADAMPRKPYCAEHAGTAYVAPETARDRPSEIAPRFARDGHSLDRYLRRGLTRTP